MRCLTGVVLLLGGCGSWFGAGAEAPPAAPTGPLRDTLIVAVASDLGNLNPVVSETAADAATLSALNLPVLRDHFDCALKPEPGLAKSWSWSDDGLTLTLALRDDVRWSDGQLVTADDIVFTYDLVRDPAVASPRRSLVAHMLPDTPVAVGPHTVAFTFTSAYDRSAQLAQASLTPVPKHLFADAERSTLRGHPASQQPIGDGPWQLARHDAGKAWLLEPNPSYSGEDKPKLGRVSFTVIPAPADRLKAMAAGQVDLIEGLEVADADVLRKARPDVKLQTRGWRANDYVAWNLRAPLFADADVRRALALAVNVDALMASLLTGADGTAYGRRMIGTISPELCDAYAADVAPLPYDPEGATTLLAGLGWRDTDGDGILDKDGVRFAFTLRTNRGNPRREAAAVAIQADLKRIGIDVTVEPLDGAALLDALRRHEFDAALAGWNAALYVDPSTFWRSDTPEHPAPSNFPGYANAQVDAWITEGLALPDPAVAAPIWKRVQAQIYADQPYLFLWWRTEIVAVDPRFEHTSINVVSTLGELARWDVPADKIKHGR